MTFLTAQADAFLNRLTKNLAHRKKIAKRYRTDAFRLYDADLPDYNAAIDVYADAAHVQEYEAPASVDAALARDRFEDVLRATALVLEIPRERVFGKVRRKQKDFAQYQRADVPRFERTIREGDARFLVELATHLDTGVFLDHRLVRARIRDAAAGVRFLNLFCYTATATVQAALGGAVRSLSVDLSNTYLEWAARNFTANGLMAPAHRLERADVVAWLEQPIRETFDAILLDPPTFSRSKRMEGEFDVATDHLRMIALCMRRLAPGGTLWFSTNQRRFELDAAVSQAFDVRDVTRQTLPDDFTGGGPVHRCFVIRTRDAHAHRSD